ncbi:MAG: flagellar protein FlaG [Pseudomonadota bacterium]|nr:flagellar protein FlaG [Pseudomonadota bacterium]
MIPSIKNQLPTLSPSPAMSGREQARDTREVPYSTGETLSMETKTAPPNGQRDPPQYLQYTGGLTPTGLQFRVDKNTDQVVIIVLRGDTGEVVREIPMKEPFSFSPTLDAIQPGQVIHAIT